MALRLEDGRRPRLFQTQPDRPIFRGFWDAGRNIECGECEGVVLLESVGESAVFPRAAA